MIKAVIFDLDDTLYDYKALERAAFECVGGLVRERLGVSEEQYEDAFMRARQTTKEMLGETATSHSRMLYFQKTLEYLDIRPLYLALEMYETYWGFFLDNMCLYPGARELLEALHEKYIRVGVCTDLLAHIQHRKLRRLGMIDDVDCMVTSEEAGAEKPASGIFELCLQKLRLPAAEVCFVGDNLERDIKGATAAGMQAIWFHTGASQEEKERDDIDVVSDYGELYELLGRKIEGGL
ncbi:MAG: HAD-IA family hydrolase [Lachnospiraceae bacterium]|nr:HAD-IA family hydrolase [Lachnospiraceae bacterium]